MRHPYWLKAVVAFGSPCAVTLAASWHDHLGHTVASAVAAGFGGLAGLVGNGAIKSRSARKGPERE